MISDVINSIAQIIEEQLREGNEQGETNASTESDELALIGQTYSASAL